MAWVQATKTAKQPSSGITVWQVVRWTFLAVLLLVVVQMLRRPSPPTLPAPTQQQALASAASFRSKLDSLAAAHDQGSSGQEARFSEDELNAYIQQSTGALPNPQDAGSATPAPVNGSEDAAGSIIKKTSVGMVGDEMTLQIVVQRFGRDIYFTLAGKLSSDNGYATFHPTRCKLGELTMPLGFIDERLQQQLNQPGNREHLKLPDFIRDLRVENGELVIVEK